MIQYEIINVEIDLHCKHTQMTSLDMCRFLTHTLDVCGFLMLDVCGFLMHNMHLNFQEERTASGSCQDESLWERYGEGKRVFF